MPPERRCEQCGKAQETIVIVWTKNGPWNVERRAEDDFSPQSLARRT